MSTFPSSRSSIVLSVKIMKRRSTISFSRDKRELRIEILPMLAGKENVQDGSLEPA